MGCIKAVSFLTLQAYFAFIGGHFAASEYPLGIRAMRSPHNGNTLISELTPKVYALGVFIWG